MAIHTDIRRLADRLIWFLPVPAIIAALTFFNSLNHYVAPGSTAELTAQAAGLIPPSGAAHPLFALIIRGIAALELLTLPLRLNLFSALCGLLCATLLFYLVARTILLFACEDAGGFEIDLAPQEEADDLDSEQAIPPEVMQYNRKILRIALAGGVIAAVTLTFMAPLWLASTRLEQGIFHLLLALLSTALFPSAASRMFGLRLFVSTLIFGLGLSDTAVFILLLPCFLFFLARTLFFSERRMAALTLAAAGGAAALLFSLYAYGQNTGAPLSLPALLSSYARRLPAHHLLELRSLFPRSGWIQLLIQTALPAGITLFAAQTLFKDKKAGSAAALGLMVFAVIPGVLNLPFAPLSFLTAALPVFSYTVIAASAAFAFAAGVIIISRDPFQEESELLCEIDILPENRLKIIRMSTGALLAVLSLCLLAAPWRNYPALRSAPGGFADQSASEMLSVMRKRTFLITNGVLDNHLRIQALIRKQPLTLIALNPSPESDQQTRLTHLIESDPAFADLNRTRLKNALALGTVQFVLEWFRSDDSAGEHAMIFATPELWTAGGFKAIPEGLAFGGTPPSATPETERLCEQNFSIYRALFPLLAPRRSERGYAAYLRGRLLIKTGFAANEFGVLLEELNRIELADQAYQLAAEGDPQNVSAAINRHTLALNHNLHPEAVDTLRKQAATAMEGARANGFPDFTAILQNYGSINQQAFYLQQTAAWSARGVRSVSADKVSRALALSKQSGIPALLENALVYRHTGDLQQTESCYRAVLEQDGANAEALTGMCTLMITAADLPAAESWLRKARDAAVEPEALRYPEIALALLRNESEQALELLYTATREKPQDLRYWTMLADILLKEGDTQLVELQVLPRMQQALNNTDHFLVHAVRGQLLRSKGAPFYREARLSLLRALALNAALHDIWSALFELDLLLNNPAFTESDARNMLTLDPDHALANYLMGSSLLARGVLPQSEDFLRRSIENRATALACNDLAENLRLQKKLADAESFARRALELDPALLPAQDTLACILYDAGRFAESAETASAAVAARPGHLTYQLTLLRAQTRLGDRQGVKQRLENIPDHEKNIPDELKREIQAL